MISRNSQIPLYVQLADEIREQIRNGEIKAGDKLPSESEMIKKYRIGRLTIRDALSILVNEGLLEKHHGKGTFCKTALPARKHRVDIFLDLSEIYFIPYYLRSICAELESENADIVMSDTKNDMDIICNLLENALNEGSDGIIFQPSSQCDTASEKMLRILDRITQSKIPYIMIDTCYKNLPQSYVVMDEFGAGKIAADYFSKMGHTTLCTIGTSRRTDSVERVRGFSKSLKYEPYKIESVSKLNDSLPTMLNTHTDITGIFCFNDSVARKCYEILTAMKIKIPEDISIISVDDTVLASTLSPALTSVIHPKEHLGKEAAKAIIAMIADYSIWPYKKVFQPSIAVRKSCCSINKL